MLPSAYTVTPKLVPQVNTDLLESVEATSTTPLTIQYVINPKAVWSDGVPVTADDFIYAWQAQRGDGTDVDGQPDQVASTLGYRDVASVTGSNGGRTVTVVFAKPFADWRVLFDHMVPAHIARKVGWNSGFASFDPAVDLSAGPLLLKSVAGGDTALLVRNPSWWGTGLGAPSVVVSSAQTDAELDRPVGDHQRGGVAARGSSPWRPWTRSAHCRTPRARCTPPSTSFPGVRREVARSGPRWRPDRRSPTPSTGRPC